MSILSMFYSIIIPIENLKRILSKEELQKVLMARNHNGKIWFDGYLYREGAMNEMDVDGIIEFWESKGLVSTEKINGKEYWKDLCLIASPETNSVLLPCDWVEIFNRSHHLGDLYANMKGKPKNRFVSVPRFMDDFFKEVKK